MIALGILLMLAFIGICLSPLLLPRGLTVVGREWPPRDASGEQCTRH